jgi:uncharacterized phiE125 gp8 family phage protein
VTTPKIISSNQPPVSVQDLRRHLRLWDDQSYDLELGSLLATATEYVAAHIGHPIGSTVEAWFPSFDAVQITQNNPTSISISYYGTNDVIQALDTDQYQIDTTASPPVIVIPNPPELSSAYINPIRLRYQTNTVSKSISHAILMVAAELFEVRTESTDAKNRIAAITIDRLLKASTRVVV